MKFTDPKLVPIIILLAFFSLQACKPKKIVQKSSPVTEAAKPTPPAAPVYSKPAEVTKSPSPVKQPPFDINKAKIQFEFDSSILRTDSYPILDQIATEIKMNPSVKYALKGYASAEGTKEHNMVLSLDRANSVKTYLVNAGISSNNISAKGFGTRNPVADNTTDAGRILNRRVEVKVVK